MLEQYSIQNGFGNIDYFIDDGYSGTNFDRPDFQRLLKEVEKGKVETIITKDLSRLGRDYLKTGYYLEQYFPENKIRFIAINDNVDTYKENNEFTPFKNIINEWYSKDISHKIRSAYKTKALKGEFTAAYAPYGYKKNPENKHQLIINEETAPIVQKIFQYAVNGITPYQIAMRLKKEGHLKPRAKMVEDLGKYVSEKYLKYPYDWCPRTILTILRNKEYLGHIVSNKHSSKSFKDKRLIALPESNWIEVSNMHEAIIDEDTFNLAQKMTIVKRKTVKSIGAYQMFVGLLKCGTCGKAMAFSRSRGIEEGNFACSTFRRYGKSYCSMHYITFRNLYEVVIDDIKKHIINAKIDKKELLEELTKNSDLKTKSESMKYDKEMKKSNKRMEEIERIIQGMYEDKVLNKITEERFISLSNKYEEEQKVLKNTILEMNHKISSFENMNHNLTKFNEMIESYTNIGELNSSILNHLIDKIVIQECTYEGKKRFQQIDIYYNFIGMI